MQVEEERVVGLAGEDLPAAGQRLDRLLAQRVVVGHGRLADPRRRDRGVLDQGPGLPAPLEFQRVRLAEQQVLVVEGGDRAVVVQERVLAPPVLGPEREPVGQVRLGVAVVVDVDVVGGVGGEREEVGSPVGCGERREARDERDAVGLVGADEGVQVGVVDRGVTGDHRCLAVAGRVGGTRSKAGQRGREEQCAGAGEQSGTPDGSGRHQGSPFRVACGKDSETWSRRWV